MPARYECFVEDELDRELQHRALVLHRKGRLPTKLRHGADGTPVVPRYSIAVAALRAFADGHDKDRRTGRDEMSQEKAK